MDSRRRPLTRIPSLRSESDLSPQAGRGGASGTSVHLPMTHPSVRPLDAIGAALAVVLCLSWGFNQVAVKLAMPDIPPLIQAATRSLAAGLLVAAWSRLRGIPLGLRDGTLLPGLVCGVLFGLEFVLIYRGLVYTTASRAVLFIYLAPFFVVLG